MITQVRNRPPLSHFKSRITVACPVMKSNVNVSMIARTASCLGVEKFIITGKNTINKHISRDCDICIEHHNTLLPVIQRYKTNGYKIIGLEQTDKSQHIYSYMFPADPIMLIVGNECKGITQDILDCLDDVIEIPLYGKPHSLNVGMATTIVLYEYIIQNL